MRSRPQSSRRLLTIERLEDRANPSSVFAYTARQDQELLLRVKDDFLQLVRPREQSAVVWSQPLGSVTRELSILARDFNVGLTIDNSVPVLPGGIRFVGGAGHNVLRGATRDTGWFVTGVGSGHVGPTGHIRFSGVEELVGAVNNRDTFVIEPGGSIARVDGNRGGYDTLVINGSSQNVVMGAFTGSSGWVTRDGVRTDYAGLEPVNLGGPVANLTLDLSGLADFGVLEATANPGEMQLRTATFTAETQIFQAPTNSLTVRLGGADDVLQVDSLATGFAADLTIDGQGGVDQVIFNGDLNFGGKGLTVDAEAIGLPTGKSITNVGAVQWTTGDLSGAGQDITVSGSLSSTSTVLLRAGDGITTASGSVISAVSTVTLRGDFNNVGTPGAIMDVLGKVTATQLIVNADNNDVVINLDRGQDVTPTSVNAGGQRNTVNVRRSNGSVDVSSAVGPTTVNLGSTAGPPAFLGSATFQAVTRQITGDFSATSIVPGHLVLVTGTTSNNGAYLVQSVTATALTLSADATLINEVAPDTRISNAASQLNGLAGAIQVIGSSNNNDVLNIDGSADVTVAGPAFNGPASVRGAGDNTVMRSAGSFIADGFTAGQAVVVAGSRLNNGRFTITAVTATQLTLDGPLFNESVSALSVRRVTGSLTDTQLTGLGLGPAGVTYSKLRNLNVFLGAGDDAFAVNGVNVATATVVDAGVGGNDAVAVSVVGNFAGNLNVTNAENTTLRVGQDLTGTFRTRVGAADLQSATIVGNIANSGVLAAGRDLGVLRVGELVNNLPVAGNQNGQVLVGRDLGLAAVHGDQTGLTSIGRHVTSLYRVFGIVTQTGRVSVAGNAAQINTGGAVSGRVDVSGTLNVLDVGGALNPTSQINVTGDLHSLTVRGLSGRVINNGTLGTLIVYGDLSGRVASGNIGRALTASGDTLTRGGQVLITGNLSGQIASTGNLFANTLVGGSMSGQVAIRGQSIAGLADASRFGILGEFRVNGGLTATSALVTVGRIGDSASGGTLRTTASNGLVAAGGAIHLGPNPTNTGTTPAATQTFANAVGGNLSAIQAIFTNGGVPLYIGTDPLGQAYVNLILIDLANLTVVGGNLLGPIG